MCSWWIMNLLMPLSMSGNVGKVRDRGNSWGAGMEKKRVCSAEQRKKHYASHVHWNITLYTYLYCIIWYLQVWYIFSVPTAIEYQHCVLLIRLRGLTWSNMFSPAQVEGYREARLWDKIFTWAEVKVISLRNVAFKMNFFHINVIDITFFFKPAKFQWIVLMSECQMSIRNDLSR